MCGDTLKDFGDRYYENTAYFNFEETASLVSIFERNYDTQRIILELELFLGRSIKPGKTLIIFDEIQEYARALTSMKYFCENAPEYHIVCAGSLLSIALHSRLSYPVGKVDFLTLYPMSFSEFLCACASETLANNVDNFKKGDAVPDPIGDKLVAFLRQYYITGGMPEVVSTWQKTNNIEEVERIQQNIINSYELDFAKHSPAKDFQKLSTI